MSYRPSARPPLGFGLGPYQGNSGASARSQVASQQLSPLQVQNATTPLYRPGTYAGGVIGNVSSQQPSSPLRTGTAPATTKRPRTRRTAAAGGSAQPAFAPGSRGLTGLPSQQQWNQATVGATRGLGSAQQQQRASALGQPLSGRGTKRSATSAVPMDMDYGDVDGPVDPADVAGSGLKRYKLIDENGNWSGTKYRNKSAYGAALKAAYAGHQKIVLLDYKNPKAPGGRVHYYVGDRYLDPNPTEHMRKYNIAYKATLKNMGTVDYAKDGSIIRTKPASSAQLPASYA